MIFLNQIIPGLSSIVILFLLELILKRPESIYYFGPVCLALIILAVRQLCRRRLKSKKSWQIVLTPVLFFLGGLFFLIFLEENFLRQFFLLSLVAILWLYLKVVYLRFHLKTKYQLHSLENISTHISLIAVFLITSSLFSWHIFINIPTWILLLIFIPIILLINSQLTWVSDSNLKFSWPYIIVIAVVLSEIFLSVSFLPTSIYVNGLIVTLGYYLTAGLARNWLLGIKEDRVIKRYFIISLVILLIILLTAKWF